MADDDPTDEMLVAAVRAEGRAIATHELLDEVQGKLPGASEAEILERLVGLVAAGRLVTRSDHGTVYFAAAGPA
jgi:hypothetical protein